MTAHTAVQFADPQRMSPGVMRGVYIGPWRYIWTGSLPVAEPACRAARQELSRSPEEGDSSDGGFVKGGRHAKAGRGGRRVVVTVNGRRSPFQGGGAAPENGRADGAVPQQAPLANGLGPRAASGRATSGGLGRGPAGGSPRPGHDRDGGVANQSHGNKPRQGGSGPARPHSRGPFHATGNSPDARSAPVPATPFAAGTEEQPASSDRDAGDADFGDDVTQQLLRTEAAQRGDAEVAASAPVHGPPSLAAADAEHATGSAGFQAANGPVQNGPIANGPTAQRPQRGMPHQTAPHASLQREHSDSVQRQRQPHVQQPGFGGNGEQTMPMGSSSAHAPLPQAPHVPLQQQDQQQLHAQQQQAQQSMANHPHVPHGPLPMQQPLQQQQQQHQHLQRPQWPAGVEIARHHSQHQQQLPPPLPAQNGPVRAPAHDGRHVASSEAERSPQGPPQLVAVPTAGSISVVPGHPDCSGEHGAAPAGAHPGGDVLQGQGSAGPHGAGMAGVAGPPHGPTSAPYPPNGMYPHHPGGMPPAAPGMVMPGPVPYLMPNGSVPMAPPGATQHPPGPVRPLSNSALVC